jgi:hypothetical protein
MEGEGGRKEGKKEGSTTKKVHICKSYILCDLARVITAIPYTGWLKQKKFVSSQF